MPEAAAALPLITGGISAVSGLFGGIQQAQQNAQTQQRIDQLTGKQQGAIDSMLGYVPQMQNLNDQWGGLRSGVGGIDGQVGGLLGQYSAPGGLMDSLSQLYGQAAAQKPMTASDNGAGMGLMGNASAVLGSTNPEAYQRQASLAGDRAMGQLNAQLAARGMGGASARLGAQTLAGLYADANAKGNADRLQAYGLSNQAMGQAGQLGLGQSQLQNSMNNDRFGLLQSLLNMRGNFIGQQSNLLGQRAGLLGQQGQMLGMQQQGLGALAGMYGNAAGMYGNAAAQQGNNINPNPWGGLGAGLGALGNAGAWYSQNYNGTPTMGIPASHGAV